MNAATEPTDRLPQDRARRADGAFISPNPPSRILRWHLFGVGFLTGFAAGIAVFALVVVLWARWWD
jgi:hypothetical protein